MIYPSIDKLLNIVDSKYMLVHIVSQRAKQMHGTANANIANLINPFMPDTPQRIACDTSQKLSIRFGETIKAYEKSDELDARNLEIIPFIFAGWLRYLMAIDDNGKAFELSPDPLLPDVCKYVEKIQIDKEFDVHSAVEDLLKKKEIFGVDLYDAGLAEKVENYFAKLCMKNGAVRSVLHEVVTNFKG